MTTDALPMEPAEVSDVELAFPAHALDLMPAMDDIPAEFKEDQGWEYKLWEDLFFVGADDLALTPMPGVDPEKAFRHLRCILGSFAPKHEHKMAALAYLTSLWYKGARWSSRDVEHSGGEA